MTAEMNILNRQFMSKRAKDVIDFYENFSDVDGLIRWMRTRPSSTSTIIKAEGNKDVVVVIPTRDAKGIYAKHCKNVVFKDQQIIFIENSKGDDLFFNYAKSVNLGIREALKFSPDWIVVCNDDVFKIDEISILTEGLSKIDKDQIDVVFTTPPGKFHSYKRTLAMLSNMGRSFYLLSGTINRNFLRLKRKFGCSYNVGSPYFPFSLRYKNIFTFTLTGTFSIFSSEYLRTMNGNIFDETYINGYEDVDLSISLLTDDSKSTHVNYKIGDMSGSSLGRDKSRFLRDISNLAYFNHKIRSGKLILPTNSNLTFRGL